MGSGSHGGYLGTFSAERSSVVGHALDVRGSDPRTRAATRHRSSAGGQRDLKSSGRESATMSTALRGGTVRSATNSEAFSAWVIFSSTV